MVSSNGHYGNSLALLPLPPHGSSRSSCSPCPPTIHFPCCPPLLWLPTTEWMGSKHPSLIPKAIPAPRLSLPATPSGMSPFPSPSLHSPLPLNFCSCHSPLQECPSTPLQSQILHTQSEVSSSQLQQTLNICDNDSYNQMSAPKRHYCYFPFHKSLSGLVGGRVSYPLEHFLHRNDVRLPRWKPHGVAHTDYY